MNTLLARIRLLIVLSLLLVAALGRAQNPTTITILPNSITAGSSTEGYVLLNAPAKNAETVDLSCNNAGITIPASVAISSGGQLAGFKITSSESYSPYTATFKATCNGATAIGLLLVQSNALPSFTGITFKPNIAFAGQKITGTVSFSSALAVPVTLDLTSNNSNFTFPKSISIAAGLKAVPFTVTPGANSPSSAVTITASLAPGSYSNVISGPTSTTGSFSYLAAGGTPPNFKRGLWIGEPLPDSRHPDYIDVNYLQTYPDGSIVFGFCYLHLNQDTDYGYYDYPEDGVGRVTASGQVVLETGDNLFPVSGSAIVPGGANTLTYTPSHLISQSTMVFSKDGTTATPNAIGQPYTWTLTQTPQMVFGQTVTLGTYTFTFVQ
jgi:hypothetical protein